MAQGELVAVELFLTAVLAKLSVKRPVAVWANVDDRRLAWVKSCVHETDEIYTAFTILQRNGLFAFRIKLTRVPALELFRPRLLFSNNFLCSAI